MWHIDNNGVARTEYDGGRKIVVRKVQSKLEQWQIIVQGNQSRFPYLFHSREAAMEAAERWLSARGVKP
jgi:hypothetical protein